MTYETWTETFGPRNLERLKFECDCGNECAAQRTECKQCGAHYDYRDGEVVQLVPPIDADSTLYE